MRIRDLMEGTSKTLFTRYGGKKMPFAQLPESAQQALHTYLGEYVEEDEYTSKRYGLVMIPAKVLAKVCWEAPDNQMNSDYDSWDDYAADYWSSEDDANYADHLANMWPVILDDGEGILDGWHRMHWYLRNGVENIPAIYFG